MNIYAFEYCDCIYESSYMTVSIHRTFAGAYNAMKNHRIKNFNDWRKLPNKYRKDFKDTFGKAWCINKIQLLD